MRWLEMRSAALALVLLLFSASTVRAEDEWWGRDKGLHFGISAALTLGAWGLSVPLFDTEAARLGFALGIGLGAGVAKELLDVVADGDASYRDLTWDVLGVGLGVLIALVLDRLVVVPHHDPGCRSPPCS